MSTYPTFDFDMFSYIVAPTNPDSNHMQLHIAIPKNHSGSVLSITPPSSDSIDITLPNQERTLHTILPVSNSNWTMGAFSDTLEPGHPYYSTVSGYCAGAETNSFTPDLSYNKYYYVPGYINSLAGQYFGGANRVPYNNLYRALNDGTNITLELDGSLIGTYSAGTTTGNRRIKNLKTGEYIETTTSNIAEYTFHRPAIQVDTSLTWTVDYGSALSISINDVLDSSASWSITPDLPDGLSFNIVTSSMVEIAGTSSTYDIGGTNYTVSAATLSGDMQVQINISIRDQWITRALNYTADSSVANAANWTISGDNVMDFSGYITSSQSRRELINLLFTRPHNSSAQTLMSTKTNLQLPSFFSKDSIIVKPSNSVIDLATISADQGVYVPTYYNGETATFLNTGGLQTVAFTASGDGVYKYTVNGIEMPETVADGDEALIAGVSFIFGSIGTEGTNNGNICIAAGAPVHTQRGIVSIECLKIGDILIDPDGNELTTVINVIRTINEDPYYYCIPKDYYGQDMPYCEILMSGEHLVQTREGQWVPARTLEGVIKKRMTKGEYVYNVHSKDYIGMCVAGIAVETVHHNNINIITRTKMKAQSI